MKTLRIKFKDGTSEEVENVSDAIDHGDDEISFFIGSGFTRYHAFDVESFELLEVKE